MNYEFSLFTQELRDGGVLRCDLCSDGGVLVHCFHWILGGKQTQAGCV